MSILWEQIRNNGEYETDLYRRLVYNICLVDGKRVDFDEVKKAVILPEDIPNEKGMYSGISKQYVVTTFLAVETGIRFSTKFSVVDMYTMAQFLRCNQLKIMDKIKKKDSKENKVGHKNYLNFIVEMYNEKIEKAHNIQKDLDAILENQERKKIIEAIVNVYVHLIGMDVFGKETRDIGQVVVAKLCIDNDIAPVVITPDKFDRVNKLVSEIWNDIETSTEVDASYICECREALVEEFDHMSKIEELEMKRAGIIA